MIRLLLLFLALASCDQYFYCGKKTFLDTAVVVSRDPKFVADLTKDSPQNLTSDPTSYVIDITGCITPIGTLGDTVGVEIKYKDVGAVHHGAVQNLLELRMVKMEYCGIREVEPGAFLELPVLETVYLRFNRMESIARGVFNKLNVVRLYLNNNSISYIDPEAFDDMPNLSLIELDGNMLKSWSTDWFTNSPNVEHVSLASNVLTELPANSFRKLRNYYSTTIRLSSNQIVYIHPAAFTDVNLLYALWLDHNHLASLDEGVFLPLDRVYILSLAGNSLACLSEDMLYNLRSEEVILHVEDNAPMTCSCLRSIERWAKTRGHFFSERYAKKECERKKEEKLMACEV